MTGVEAKDYVTAHKALQLGNCILNLMVGMELKKFKFPRKMAVVNMAAVQIKGKSKSYTIDPNFLFQRLLSSIILRREDIEVGTVFNHELRTFPPRLFATEELLLAADTKSELAKSFPSLEDPASSNRDDMKYVIYGGMLIHRITWKVGSSFTDIFASYVSFNFMSKYPQCAVVFDGYRNSTKDMAHKVRSKNLSCSNITLELSTCLTVKKAQFLSNPGNKQRFIDLLSEYLIRSGFSCLNAQSDADVLIRRTAVTLLQTKCDVTVVGDDTDLLVILIDMTRNLSLNRWTIFLSTKTNIYDLKSVITSIGIKGASSILQLHSFSFTGCETLSRIFGVGQGRLLNIRGKLTESIIQTFYSHDSTKEEIKSVGEKIFFLLLNLSPSDGKLDAARLRLFNSKVIKGCAAIDSTSLPPTSAFSSCL